MIRTLKALSALLSYPTAELQAAAPELRAALTGDKLLAGEQLGAVNTLIEDLAGRDLYDAQERYVLLFDRTRSLSLYLFEHVHGESRDRGQAMVDLIALYEAAGFSPTASELPDFLPLFLEFAATRPLAEAIELLGQPAHVLYALGERLTRRQSAYAGIFAALGALARAEPDTAMRAALREEADPEPDDLAALDAAWEEEEVMFGPGPGADCKDTLIAKLRQARRPAPGVDAGAGPRPVIRSSSAAEGARHA